MDEAEGVALVETGFDSYPFLKELASAADDIRGEVLGKRGVYWSFKDGEIHGNEPNGVNGLQHHPEFHRITTEAYVDRFGLEAITKIHKAGVEILGLCADVLDEPKCTEGNYTILNLSNRVRGGDEGHIDEVSLISVWHGASEQGLRLGSRETGVNVLRVPAGYVLVWRGGRILGEELATRHTVDYRSSVTRVSAVTF